MNALDVLRLLRWQIALAIVLAIVGASGVFFAQRAHDEARSTLERAQRESAQASNRLLQARQQEGDLREAIDKYAQLRETGLIGPEQRLNWVEILDASRQRLRLGPVRYEIQPQHRLDGNGSPGALAWMESRMRLSLEVRHTQVLLDLLDDLQTVSSAIVQPRACRIQRETNAAGLAAECDLRWLTIRQETPR